MLRRMGVYVIGLASILASGASLAQKPTPGKGPTIVGGIAQYFGRDSYPADAIQAKREGRVVAKVGVDATGAVTSCTVSTSSGTASLDSRTCTIVFSRARFNPATDAHGQPTAGSYTLAVRWVLPTADSAPHPVDLSLGFKDYTVEVELAYAADGILLSCRQVANTLPGQSFDPCEHFRVGERTRTRWSVGENPVGAKVVQRMTVHITPEP